MRHGPLKHLAFAALFVTALVPVESIRAADDSISIGTTFKLRSEILGTERTILVHTPAAYEAGTLRYPVLYLTDGEYQFQHTVTTVDFLARSGKIPALIVVGISTAGGDRTHDLTPTQDLSQPGFASSGGGEIFLNFVEKELIPHVERSYRTLPFRAFAGHSFGGVFALHAFATRPALFGGVISASPVLNWDKNRPLEEVKQLLAGRNELNATLYVTMGNEGPGLRKNLAELKGTLEKASAKGLSWQALELSEEDHGSGVLLAYYQGLLKIFEGWRYPIDVVTGRPKGDLAAVKAHYGALATRFGTSSAPPEVLVNLLGYTELGAKHAGRALEAFRYNVATHPGSANAHDSLGEGLESTGDLAAARESYARAVEIATKSSDRALPIFQKHVVDCDAKLAVKKP
ncbi:MAG: alpha/beta hydrolase-fold protein [Thermoanaerobaculia bacterium]